MTDTEYRKEIVIARPDCDASGKLSLGNVMRCLQGIASEHLDALALGEETLWEEGFVYLLNRVRLQIRRRPLAREAVTLLTKPRGAKGALSHRDVLFYDKQEETLIHAQSAWILADPTTHRVRRPSELGHVIPVEACKYDYSWCKERLTRPDHAQLAGEQIIRYSQIDVNQHLNNAVYSDLVCDYLPAEALQTQHLADYTIGFAGEIRLGERLAVYRAALDAGGWYIGGDRPDGSRCFDAILRFDV